MEQSDLLKLLCNHLERIEVRYFITESQATIAYGEPRFTNDIDVVVDLDSSNCDVFCDGFPPEEFYLNRETARQEVARRGMFNIIHPASGLKSRLKIDVIIPSKSSFDQQRFERGVRIPIAEDCSVIFSSPEDIILQNMTWRQTAGAERHLRDINGILKVGGDALDSEYIEQQARELGVTDLWHEIARKVSPG
jgi:hypothetical protein